MSRCASAPRLDNMPEAARVCLERVHFVRKAMRHARMVQQIDHVLYLAPLGGRGCGDPKQSAMPRAAHLLALRRSASEATRLAFRLANSRTSPPRALDRKLRRLEHEIALRSRLTAVTEPGGPRRGARGA